LKPSGDATGWFADDMLEDMPYTDAVIKEVMRLYGIVDGIWRQTLEDIIIQGHHIPKVEVCSTVSQILNQNGSASL